MTYLFAIIGISMLNAFSKKMSLTEIGFINVFILVLAYFTEQFLKAPKNPTTNSLKSRSVIYGNLENIKPENNTILLNDLKEITGLNIEEIKIGKLNIKEEEVELKIYFKSNN